MILSLRDILRVAEQKKLSKHEIAKITGKNFTTVWRWYQDPDMDFVFDKGMRELVNILNGEKP